MNEKTINETHTIPVTYTPYEITTQKNKINNDIDFAERCKTFNTEVSNILHERFDESKKEDISLATAEIGLLYAKRENDLMHHILDMIIKELGLCEKGTDE